MCVQGRGSEGTLDKHNPCGTQGKSYREARDRPEVRCVVNDPGRTCEETSGNLDFQCGIKILPEKKKTA